MSRIPPTRSAAILATMLIAATATAASTVPADAANSMRANVVVEAVFTGVDINHDGKIDAGEMAAAREKRFARLDTDGDGAISTAELEQLQTRIKQRAQLLEDVLALRLDTLDADGDGLVTRVEFLSSQPTATPLLADTDGDGMISKDEMLRVVGTLPAFQ